jgi:hypothetical protein
MGKKSESIISLSRLADEVKTSRGVITLSLKDLERLGVIKKRLKRKRRNKKLANVLEALIGGAKSDSSHMKGYTNHFASSSNLTTEGQRLQNQQNQLLNDIQGKQHKELDFYRNDNQNFQNNTKNFQNSTRDIISYLLTNPDYKTIDNENRVEEIPNTPQQTPLNTRFDKVSNKSGFYDKSDNIDVPHSVSSDDFSGSPVPTKSHLQNIDENIQSFATPSTSQSPLLNNRFSTAQAIRQGLFFTPFSGILNPKPQNENPIRPSPPDFTQTKPPELKRQTSGEKFNELQAQYIDEGIPSSIIEKAENTRQLNSLVNKYKEIQKYKKLGGNFDYYIDNIDNITLQHIKGLVEQQRKKSSKPPQEIK